MFTIISTTFFNFKEKYKIIEGGKISLTMPDVIISYYDNEHKEETKLLAELICFEMQKPKFSNEIEKIVNNLAQNIFKLKICDNKK